MTDWHRWMTVTIIGTLLCATVLNQSKYSRNLYKVPTAVKVKKELSVMSWSKNIIHAKGTQPD